MKRAVIAAITTITISLPVSSARADEFVNVLTGGTSGVYYPLGVALSKIYGEKIDGVRTQVQATKASVENLNLRWRRLNRVGDAVVSSARN
ncbi:TAXI family TRAP transporter solute-binding subunit, partial [Ensifer sp. SSB1]|uniref:TAXI family TRAP transporter solute-binding subunit n=1 Tax=Ensifer sp. SSB1 TaxID=2795385 RepID=UPI001A5D2A85